MGISTRNGLQAGFIVGFAWLWLGLTVSNRAIAATMRFSSIAPAKLHIAANYNPPNNGGSGGGRSGASRPGCPNLDKKFTALVPHDHFGETVSERPTFWLYVPYASKIEFILMNPEDSRILYRQEFEASSRGVVGFRPSQMFLGLDVGQSYRWRFDFFCSSSNRSSVLQTEGLIIRRSTPVDSVPSQNRADFYAENGLWYDALTEVATFLETNPNDEENLEDWADLLTHPSVELDEFVQDIPVGNDASN